MDMHLCSCLIMVLDAEVSVIKCDIVFLHICVEIANNSSDNPLALATPRPRATPQTRLGCLCFHNFILNALCEGCLYN